MKAVDPKYSVNCRGFMVEIADEGSIGCGFYLHMQKCNPMFVEWHGEGKVVTV